MSISHYLPSKKFSLILGICVLVGVGYFIFIRSTSSHSTKLTKKTLELTPEQIIEGDRDGDGVRDWEEALWGTNPDKKDSDENGIDDLAEIDNRRKKIAESQGLDPEDSSSKTLNETDLFSRDIFASIISLREKGALNEESIKTLANAAGKSFSGNMELGNIVELENILTTKGDTLEQKKEYLKKINTLLTNYWKKGINEEFKVFAEYSVTENKDILIELVSTSKTYEALSLELKSMTVPESMAVTQRDFINNTHKISIALQNISQSDSNELISTIGIAQYKEQSAEFTRLLNIFTGLIAEHDIL